MPNTSSTPALHIFTQQELDQLIADTIPKSLPDDHKNAVVFGVNQNGAHVGALFTKHTDKFGTWQFKAGGEIDFDGEKKAGFDVIDSW